MSLSHRERLFTLLLVNGSTKIALVSFFWNYGWLWFRLKRSPYSNLWGAKQKVYLTKNWTVLKQGPSSPRNIGSRFVNTLAHMKAAAFKDLKDVKARTKCTTKEIIAETVLCLCFLMKVSVGLLKYFTETFFTSCYKK